MLYAMHYTDEHIVFPKNSDILQMTFLVVAQNEADAFATMITNEHSYGNTDADETNFHIILSARTLPELVSAGVVDKLTPIVSRYDPEHTFTVGDFHPISA
jgi:hypothetical protein